jgi:methionyl-tRNA formyltransferase
MRFVYFGSADFGLPSLERLLSDGHQAVGVVTTPDRQQGRGLKSRESPVALRAHELGFGPVLKPEKLDCVELADTLRACAADMFIVIAYRILPERIFTIPPLGTLNVHASLLPRYRGPAPIQRAIEHGETRTGVSVFRIDAGVDTGGILVQRDTVIGHEESAPELYQRLSVLGADALSEAVRGLAAGTSAPRPQEDVAASKAPKLRKEEALIDWSQPASVIHNRVRAFQLFPGSHTFLDGKRLAVIEASADGCDSAGEPGTVAALDSEGFVVRCGQGMLRVRTVKPEGKDVMRAADFARGARIEKGKKLG